MWLGRLLNGSIDNASATFRIIRDGRDLGAFASPERATVEAMKVIGAEVRIVGGCVEFDGNQGHGWELLGTIDHFIACMARKPLYGVRILRQP